MTHPKMSQISRPCARNVHERHRNNQNGVGGCSGSVKQWLQLLLQIHGSTSRWKPLQKITTSQDAEFWGPNGYVYNLTPAPEAQETFMKRGGNMITARRLGSFL